MKFALRYLIIKYLLNRFIINSNNKLNRFYNINIFDYIKRV